MPPWLRDRLPFLDLAGYSRGAFARDVAAAGNVTFMSVPQGVAYAIVAGLPPAMGLYAACVPAIIGSFFRSSRHVITGPSNAVSLLVGTVGAAAADLDPASTALLLAFLVGATQLSFGVLRLGVLVDYISLPVVMGYIFGAGILIGVGQLPNLTQTTGGGANLFEKVYEWGAHLSSMSPLSVGIGALSAAAIVGLRKLNPRLPGAMIVLSALTGASFLFDFEGIGLSRIEDLAPVPSGLPPLTLPDGVDWSFEGWDRLVPIAFAVTVLSLVESSAVARSISARTGQQLDLDQEFTGQGLANISAAFFGGYPVSGSLVRSSINHRSGAQTRMAGALSGVMSLLVLLMAGPAIDYTPVAGLAGLLLVVAVDLVNIKRVRKILKARRSDAAAFLVTLIGTTALRLDQAIYVGVAVSLFLFLRRARMLQVHEVLFDELGQLVELPLFDPRGDGLRCPSIRVVNVEGQLFFGATTELSSALDALVGDEQVSAVVLRIRRAHGMDFTTIQALLSAARRMNDSGRHLFIVGVRGHAHELLTRTGAVLELGEDHLFPTTKVWFEASDAAMKAALEVVGEHDCKQCSLIRHLKSHDVTPPFGEDDEEE